MQAAAIASRVVSRAGVAVRWIGVVALLLRGLRKTQATSISDSGVGRVEQVFVDLDALVAEIVESCGAVIVVISAVHRGLALLAAVGIIVLDIAVAHDLVDILEKERGVRTKDGENGENQRKRNLRNRKPNSLPTNTNCFEWKIETTRFLKIQKTLILKVLI